MLAGGLLKGYVPDMPLIIEVRSAEGGDDSKDLVRIQVGIYQRFAVRRGL